MRSEKRKFNDIYNELVEETKEFFVELKRKQVRNLGLSAIVAIVLTVLVKIVNGDDFILFIPLALAIMLLGVLLGNYYYRKQYKEIIVGKLIQKYDSDFTYTQDGGPVTEGDYVTAGFDRNWDSMEKADGIYGTLEDGSRCRMAQITTYKNVVYLDDQGRKQIKKEQTYKGSFCVVTLNKVIKNQIEITGNSRRLRYNKDRIEVDSQSFEEEFDMMAKDKVQALRIFTPDVISIIVSLRERIKVPFRIRIEGDRLYIKIDNGDIFEPISYKAELSASAILEYYNTIDIPVSLATVIIRGAIDL